MVKKELEAKDMFDESPRFDLFGWNPRIWLNKNKGSLKLMLPLIAALFVDANVPIKLIVAAGGRLGLDLIDYFTSKVKL